MTDENAVREGVRVDEVIEVVRERKPFTPETPLADIETPFLKGAHKRDFILAVNATRLGINKFTVAVGYELQVADSDLRIAGRDYVEVDGISAKLHMGVMTTATFNKNKQFYIRLADTLRSDGLKPGWTSMRATGITSFKILSMELGPVLAPIPFRVGE